ncbi:hypothetical protein OG884_26660 [Streptosporangium sp. NBC_01755]|uniref:hypothetical protein n=1 Tax=Streptosporangium sp. NBC_01755 TaxID=2975949 RepID=UPI002DDA1E04|nr:hypothetical protein [Streptosporangium sp. NBC_01755]WSC98432.1 hypothetical protein OG884_26660 [Streptosporangium sp. NBC_01755]
MGWASGGVIFDDVAHALIEAGAADELKRRTLGKLIDWLREEDWDTETESLEEFRDDSVIVALFRERGITMQCSDRTGPTNAGVCTRKLGHAGDHVDHQDFSWSQAVKP